MEPNVPVKKEVVWIAVFDKERRHMLLKALVGGKMLGLIDGAPFFKEPLEQAAYRIVREATGLTGLRMLDPCQTGPVVVIREPGRDIHVYRFWHQDIRSLKPDCVVRDYKWLIPMLYDRNIHSGDVKQYDESNHRSSNLNF